MRLIDKYFIKEMVIPFILSLLVITFLLFINFLLRAVDRFLGKGLDILIIFEYLFLNLAWILALSVPMAILLATLTTFGKLSEGNEINAMRASGIGFLTIIRSPLIFGFSIAILLIIFNNLILPEMNFKARLLSGDIYRKRPGINIEPGYIFR
jgi:Predicted permeases